MRSAMYIIIQYGTREEHDGGVLSMIDYFALFFFSRTHFYSRARMQDAGAMMMYDAPPRRGRGCT